MLGKAFSLDFNPLAITKKRSVSCFCLSIFDSLFVYYYF